MLRHPLNPSLRARDFIRKVQSTRIGDYAELTGFLIMRKPPMAPQDAIYYLLSPLSPSDFGRSDIKPYVVLRIDQNTKIKGRIRSGDHVRVWGFMDSYPLGTIRMIHTVEMEGRDYSLYWEDYRDMALSREEIEELLRGTIYANRQLEDSIVYSLFGSPFSPLFSGWGEGVSVSAVKDSESAVRSLWMGLRYIIRILPDELVLRRNRKIELADEELDMDFILRFPESPVKYYVPGSLKLLKGREIPKWLEGKFTGKRAVFLTPRFGKPDPLSVLSSMSEAPFLLYESVGFEKNREMEELAGNLIVSIFLHRSKVETLSPESLELYRMKFEDWLHREHVEYGEKFDALRVSGRIFDTGMRMKLGLRLFGAMARLEGRERRSFISRVLSINTELVDLWINELPASVMMKLIKDYEKYVSGDRRANEALRIFMDMSSTREEGEVTREEFLTALIRYGFKRRDAEETIDRLLGAGYLYEPFPGKLRLVDV